MMLPCSMLFNLTQQKAPGSVTEQVCEAAYKEMLALQMVPNQRGPLPVAGQ